VVDQHSFKKNSGTPTSNENPLFCHINAFYNHFIKITLTNLIFIEHQCKTNLHFVPFSNYP